MQIKLGDFLREICIKTVVNNEYPVLTSSKNGIYLQSEYFNKQVASKDNTGYKIIKKGQFTYRAMSDTGEFYPNMLKCVDIGIVSPAYPVFEITNRDIIYPQYLQYFFRSNTFRYNISGLEQGSTRTSIKFNKMKNIKIKLPPLLEQKKVIMILDRVGSLISKRQEQLKYFDELTKSLFIEMFGDIINTSKYPTVNLGSLGEMLSGGTPSSEHSEYFGGNIPFISTPCLGENYISYKNAQNFLTDEGVKNSTTNLIPAYSLMIGSRVGVGKCSINMCEMCTNQDILSFINIDKTKYDLLFIKNVIEQHFDFYESQKRGATIKGISSKIVKETKVPKAPLLLQKKFANFVRGTDKSKYSSFSHLSA